MKIKLESQSFQKAKKRTDRYERKHNKDIDLWSSQYVTDLDMNLPTYDVYGLVEEFIDRHFLDEEYPENKVFGIDIMRNGMLGLWEFRVITNFEVLLFEYSEETSTEKSRKALLIADIWFEREGRFDYPEAEWSVVDAEEAEDGSYNVYLFSEISGTVIVPIQH